MLILKNSGSQELRDIAECHMSCFPTSFSTRLGKSYVAKSIEWFLKNPNRFLFHVRSGDKVLGYCGGFLPAKIGDGSSSGMLQHAFKEAIKGVIKNPLLLFHPEIRHHYPFIWLNLKRKITGKAIPIKSSEPAKPLQPFDPSVGLVVIGVHPEARGTNVLQMLMEEFDKHVKLLNKREGILSVKKSNERAIYAYKKYGWNIKLDKGDAYLMHKII